jgi:hypothetical protein
MSATDENRIEIWKTIIDVQKHFNELEMRIRNVAVTVLAAFLAAAGFTMKENMHVTLWIGRVSLTSLVLLGAALCWLAFYGMDRFWYHRLLIGSVKQGLVAEGALAATYPEIRLTKAIGDESPITIGSRQIHSSRKIDIFYWLIASLLLAGAAISLCRRAPSSPPPKPAAASAPVREQALPVTAPRPAPPPLPSPVAASATAR